MRNPEVRKLISRDLQFNKDEFALRLWTLNSSCTLTICLLSEICYGYREIWKIILAFNKPESIDPIRYINVDSGGLDFWIYENNVYMQINQDDERRGEQDPWLASYEERFLAFIPSNLAILYKNYRKCLEDYASFTFELRTILKVYFSEFKHKLKPKTFLFLIDGCSSTENLGDLEKLISLEIKVILMTMDPGIFDTFKNYFTVRALPFNYENYDEEEIANIHAFIRSHKRFPMQIEEMPENIECIWNSIRSATATRNLVPSARANPDTNSLNQEKQEIWERTEKFFNKLKNLAVTKHFNIDSKLEKYYYDLVKELKTRYSTEPERFEILLEVSKKSVYNSIQTITKNQKDLLVSTIKNTYKKIKHLIDPARISMGYISLDPDEHFFSRNTQERRIEIALKKLCHAAQKLECEEISDIIKNLEINRPNDFIGKLIRIQEICKKKSGLKAQEDQFKFLDMNLSPNTIELKKNEQARNTENSHMPSQNSENSISKEESPAIEPKFHILELDHLKQSLEEDQLAHHIENHEEEKHPEKFNHKETQTQNDQQIEGKLDKELEEFQPAMKLNKPPKKKNKIKKFFKSIKKVKKVKSIMKKVSKHF